MQRPSSVKPHDDDDYDDDDDDDISLSSCTSRPYFSRPAGCESESTRARELSGGVDGLVS